MTSFYFFCLFQLSNGKRGAKSNASSFVSITAHSLSDVSCISNVNLSRVNETACSSAMSSRLDPPPDELENLDISTFQAPEDLLDGCRVCLTIDLFQMFHLHMWKHTRLRCWQFLLEKIMLLYQQQVTRFCSIYILAFVCQEHKINSLY